MAKAEKMTVTLTEALTKEHKKRLHHQEKTPVAKYKVRDTVRLQKPSKLNEHLQATYNVPAAVQKRLGEDIYTLKAGKRLYRDRYHFQMKPRVSKPRGKHVQFDYADLEVHADDPFTREHEYNAWKILGYCSAPDVPGGYTFRTQWEGFGCTHDKLEPVSAFLPSYTRCFVDFVKRGKIHLKVTGVCVPKKA